MNIELLLTKLKDLENDNYRVHLAKTAYGESPLNALASGSDSWENWQIYKGGKRNRFPSKYIVTFAQINGNTFLFGGIFEIIDRSGEVYDVILLDFHKNLIGRLVIEYESNLGQVTVVKSSTFLQNSRIKELYSTRYRGEVFKSVNSINHNYSSLEVIFKNELSDWKTALSSVKGIYLLTDMKEGKHYVGSAYGEGGIWGRWSNYIYGYTGGNKELVELKDKFTEEYFKENFKFSILETVGSIVTKEEILRLEALWKEKLLTRTHGYNSN